MEYRELGASGMKVSVITFGCWAIAGPQGKTPYGYGPPNDAESTRAIRRALDLGINLFDTADVYGLGHSEEVLGKALGADRKKVFIATKAGHEWDENGWTQPNLSKDYILKACERSLRRLQTDAIDLYQLHTPPKGEFPMAETMGALTQLQKAGKIRSIGVSNFGVPLMEECLKHGPIHSLQPPYNLLRREVEGAILPFCRLKKIGVIVYEPLGKGLFTGKFTAESKFPADDVRSVHSFFNKDNLARNLELVAELKKVAEGAGKTVGQLAVAWVLRDAVVTSAIVGAKTAKQVEENAGASGWSLTEEQKKEIEGLLQRRKQ